MNREQELAKVAREIKKIKAELQKTGYWTKVFDKAAKAFNKGDRDPAEKAAFEYLKGYMSKSMAEEWAQTVVYSWLRKPIKGRDIEEACENAITNAF